MDSRRKSPEDAIAFVHAVATKQGWAVNPDTGFVGQLATGLSVNYNRYGYYLCPCRDGDGDRAADRDIVCPCDYARPDLDEFGHCFCALFLRPGFVESGGQADPIPERRPDCE